MMKQLNLISIFLLSLIIVVAGFGSLSFGGQSDKDLLNAMLDTIESGMAGKSSGKIISVMSFPVHYYEFGDYDQASFESVLETTFQMHTYSVFEFTRRTITVNGSNATVQCTEHAVWTGFNSGNDSNPSVIHAVKTGGFWKFNRFVHPE